MKAEKGSQVRVIEFADDVASDIALRDAPLARTTLDEIERIAQPGARVTYSNADVENFLKYIKQLQDKFPNARIVEQGTIQGALGERGFVIIELSGG